MCGYTHGMLMCTLFQFQPFLYIYIYNWCTTERYRPWQILSMKFGEVGVLTLKSIDNDYLPILNPDPIWQYITKRKKYICVVP